VSNLKVSIIIPCRNEELYIERCIFSILNSNYPKESIDIFISDGLSTDKTRSIVKNLSNKYDCIHLIDNNNKTTPYALNLGLKKSTADVKIILGAHAEIYPDFIIENINIFKIDEKIGCVGGVISNVYENETAEIIGQAMSSPFGVGNAHFRTGNKNGYVDTVAFGAYKKEVFENIGFFDEELARNQDDEFNYRLTKYGYKVYLSDKIKSKYYVRGSFLKLFKQYFQYGYWKVLVNKKHKTITTVRQLIPLFFVLFIISGAIASIFHSFLFYSYITILFIYLALALFSAIDRTSSLKKTLLLIFTFFGLHFSYGLGYFLGIIDFFVLNKKPNEKSKSLTR
jgi:glycosyltransferase involved in cell wall biosynthesis